MKASSVSRSLFTVQKPDTSPFSSTVAGMQLSAEQELEIVMRNQAALRAAGQPFMKRMAVIPVQKTGSPAQQFASSVIPQRTGAPVQQSAPPITPSQACTPYASRLRDAQAALDRMIPAEMVFSGLDWSQAFPATSVVPSPPRNAGMLAHALPPAYDYSYRQWLSGQGTTSIQGWFASVTRGPYGAYGPYLDTFIAGTVVPRINARAQALQNAVDSAQGALNQCMLATSASGQSSLKSQVVGAAGHVQGTTMNRAPVGGVNRQQLNARVPVNPAGQLPMQQTGARYGVPQPLVALGRMSVTCGQWTVLSAALKASLVRGVLEGMGFTSLNGANRGDIVYKLVDQINNYCIQQGQLAALRSRFVGPAGLAAAGCACNDNTPMTSDSVTNTEDGMLLKPAGQSLGGLSFFRNMGSAWGNVWGNTFGRWFGTPVFAPVSIFSRMNVTCNQWVNLSLAQKASIARGMLEQGGYTSLNNPIRGSIVYDLIARLDAHCSSIGLVPVVYVQQPFQFRDRFNPFNRSEFGPSVQTQQGVFKPTGGMKPGGMVASGVNKPASRQVRINRA